MSDRPRRLILLRHAKAEAHTDTRDFDRGLTGPGRHDATAMGRWLKEHRLVPDAVLCSTALRTRETWEQVAAAGALGALIEHSAQVYNASVPTLLQLVRELEPAAHTAVVVGHAPGIPGLAATLAEGRQGTDQLAAGFPTCTAAIMTIPDGWADLAAGTASIETVHTARAPEE